MCDDVDLYEDLPILNFGESVSKIDEERQHFKKQLDEKEADLNKTKEHIARLKKEKKILEDNISSLYRTAVCEIKRKDQLIEELRREKESLIFRRKNKQNQQSIKSTAAVSSSEAGNNAHQISDLPAKHHPTEVEPSKPVLPSSVNTVTKTSLETKSHGEPSSDFSIKYNSSYKSPSSSHVSDPVQRDHGDSCGSASDVNTTVTETNNKTFENNSSVFNDTLSDKLSLDSSQEPHFPHRSGSKEHSWETSVPKNEKRSDERRDKHKQRDYYSDKPNYTKNWHRLPNNSHRSMRLPNERNRRDRVWDCNDKKYYRGKESFQGPKLSAEPCNESRRKYQMHSRRSPSPQWRNPVRNYSDRRSWNSNVSARSDNVRVATQLKSKYSKAMREKSISRSPVKQHSFIQNQINLESSSKQSKLQSASCSLFPKLNLDEKVVGHDNENNPSCSEKTTGTLSKYCSKDIFSETLNETSQELLERKCNPFQSLGNNSEASDNICQTNKNENVKKEEIFVKSEVKIEDSKHNSCAQTDIITDISNSKSLQKEGEAIIKYEEIDHGNLPMQHLRTPPSKNLVPLKISPSFEDPAIIKEEKFSFSVFNEQCEFKRLKRKRSVKVHVSEIKDENNKKVKNELNNDGHCQGDITKKQNTDSYQQNDNILKERVSSEKKSTVNCKPKAELNNDKTFSEVANRNSTKDNMKQETSVLSKDTIHSSEIVTLNKEKLSEDDMQKNKSPNKKRKLDSICEELKANLEKKNVTNCSKSISDDNTKLDNANKLYGTAVNKQTQYSDTVVNIDNVCNSKTTASEAVTLMEPPKIVINKPRRKIRNLQDNVVQVLSQVKSRLS